MPIIRYSADRFEVNECVWHAPAAASSSADVEKVRNTCMRFYACVFDGCLDFHTGGRLMGMISARSMLAVLFFFIRLQCGSRLVDVMRELTF